MKEKPGFSPASSMAPGERILWQGHPDRRGPRPYANSVSRGLCFLWSIGIAIMIMLFIRDSGIAVFSRSAAVAFGAMALPFIGIGYYRCFGFAWHDRYLRRGTVYLLTNRRALITVNGLLTAHYVIPITPDTVVTEVRATLPGRLDRRTIIFGPTWPRRTLDITGGIVTKSEDAFEMLADGRACHALIKDIIAGRHGPDTP